MGGSRDVGSSFPNELWVADLCRVMDRPVKGGLLMMGSSVSEVSLMWC